ncbi:MAG: signal peptide peptidase SppA [Sphingobacteriales bacterium]|nr:MAG: signal peptide peptidase SppA [Sphingobacteriales bacterium]
MKQFFKFVFASMLGVFLSIIVFIVIFSAIIFGVVNSSKETVEVDENTILHINLDYPIVERTEDNPLEDLDFGPFKSQKTIGLNDILKSINHAATDDKITGIYLDATYLMAGMATTEEIRNALINFKKSGKFIIAYSEVYTQKAYYLASVANKIYVNPQGILELKGFSNQNMFFKGALDKLEVEAQIIKVGTYKSAVEPFILNKMSDANKLQMNSLLNSLYTNFVDKIAQSRNLNVDTVKSIANNLKIRTPQDALKLKFIDGLRYKDEVLDELKAKCKIDKKKNLTTVNVTDYASSITTDEEESVNKIAVIYANGEINGGEGDESAIGSEGISRSLRKARLDEKVKAVVLRVNSPGGSSLASDVIWREVLLTKQAKPIIVSMGDYAASGGYYIACAADSIIAEPNTITGSIGVFAIIPNLKGLLNNKLGITFDGVKTGNFADLGDVTRPLTDAEKMILQKEVNRVYSDFTLRVSQGRKIPQAAVDSIGQGRVWTGTQALKLKLVDKLGHLNDAIAVAAKKANLKDYRLVAYPEQKTGFFSFLEKSGDKIKQSIIKTEMGDTYNYYQKLKQASTQKGIYMRLPVGFNGDW